MILSNVELFKALDSHRLVIDPQPTPRFPEPNIECPFGTHSVDLKLAANISIPTGGPVTIDLSRPGSLSEYMRKNSEQRSIATTPYRLEPNKFILAQTKERIELPLPKKGKKCLAARIEGKSSRARCGILVHFTAPTVHPGFEGNLTLEMINLGPVPFNLVYDMPIAQLIVEEVMGRPIENPSQYQGQRTPEGTRS